MRRATAFGVLLLAATAVTGCGAFGSDGSAGNGDRADRADRAAPASTPDPSSTGPASPAPDPQAPSGWGPTLGEIERARTLVEGLGVEEKVVTVLMPGFWGYDGADPTPAEAAQNEVMHGVASPVDVVTAQPYGGFFLRPEVIADAGQVRRLAGRLHDAGDGPDGLPLLLSMDQEGGVVQRLKSGVDVVPSAASVGASGDPAYARSVARDNGRTLRELGVTMVLAPVADVDPDGTSVMGSRTYSGDHDTAAEMVVATVEGYLRAGVVPAVKHFPGLGTVTGDSHRSLPVQRKSVAELERTDLRPFAAAVDAGAPVVMTAHVAVRAIDPGMPASLSADVIATLLRGRLGFEGVAVTDSQGMGPVHGRFGPAEGAVRSLLAGNDLILNSPKPERARRALLRAVASGRVPQERLDEAATRVMALRIYQQRLAEAAR
jgi:beta-N-acetylhexosaminidase